MSEQELYERIGIAAVMGWGLALKLVTIGFRADLDNGPETPFHLKYLWHNSNKWRIIGSMLFTGGLAFIAPHEGFRELSEFVVYGGIPIGHLGVGALGYCGDDLWLGLSKLSDKVKAKINRNGATR